MVRIVFIDKGRNFEEARENLIDAIEFWVTVGLKKGEKVPVANGCRIAADVKGSIKKKLYA